MESKRQSTDTDAPDAATPTGPNKTEVDKGGGETASPLGGEAGKKGLDQETPPPSPLVGQSLPQPSQHTTEEELTRPGAVAVAGLGGTRPSGRQYDSSRLAHSDHVIEHENDHRMEPIASLVVDDTQATGSSSQPVLPLVFAKRDKWTITLCGRQIHAASIIAAIVVVVVVAVAVPLATRSGSNGTVAASNRLATSTPTISLSPSEHPSYVPSDTPTNLPTQVPSVSPAPSALPSQNPTSERMLFFKNALVPVSGEEALEDPNSPQYSALTWMVHGDEYQWIWNQRLEEQMRQRYIMVLIYFSTGGDFWTNQLNFLTSAHECAWVGVSCNDNANINTVTGVSLADNNLTGTLVDEIGYLWNLSILWMENNQLSGTLPDSLTNLSGLTWFAFNYNRLRGTIPASLGNRSLLEVIGLANNQFFGTVPTQLQGLTSLERLQIDNNDLSGNITFLCVSAQNLSIWADCGGDDPEIVCPCCTYCCDDVSGECCDRDGSCFVCNWMFCI